MERSASCSSSYVSVPFPSLSMIANWCSRVMVGVGVRRRASDGRGAGGGGRPVHIIAVKAGEKRSGRRTSLTRCVAEQSKSGSMSKCSSSYGIFMVWRADRWASSRAPRRGTARPDRQTLRHSRLIRPIPSFRSITNTKSIPSLANTQTPTHTWMEKVEELARVRTSRRALRSDACRPSTGGAV